MGGKDGSVEGESSSTAIRLWWLRQRRPEAAEAAAGRLHADDTRSRLGEAAETAAARGGAAAVAAAETAVDLP